MIKIIPHQAQWVQINFSFCDCVFTRYISSILLDAKFAQKKEDNFHHCISASVTCELLGGVLFGEMKFVLLNFLSNEDLSISYES